MIEWITAGPEVARLTEEFKSSFTSTREQVCTDWVPTMPTVDAKILDGSVLVNMLLPKSSATFEQYKENAFLPYILKGLQQVSRVDIVFTVILKIV